MVLATAKIEDFDRFWNTFSTKGAEKRKQHGCKGAHVFRDPNESDRVWAIFDWDEAGWQRFHLGPRGPGDLSGSRLYARPAQVGGVPPPARRLDTPAPASLQSVLDLPPDAKPPGRPRRAPQPRSGRSRGASVRRDKRPREGIGRRPVRQGLRRPRGDTTSGLARISRFVWRRDRLCEAGLVR